MAMKSLCTTGQTTLRIILSTTPFIGDSIKNLLKSFIDYHCLEHTQSKLLQEFDNESSDFYGYRIVRLRFDEVDFDDEDLAYIEKLRSGINYDL